jgi:Flp pilus assembly protein TadD
VARYQKILQRQPDTLAAEIGLGVAYDTQGKHSQAQTIYRQGILTHPYDLNLHNDLGLSLVLSGQLRAGISELSSIVDDPSAPPQTRQNLALAYGLLGNNVQAEHILQADLPQAQVQNNLQYYRFLRTRLSQPDAMPTQSPLP